MAYSSSQLVKASPRLDNEREVFDSWARAYSNQGLNPTAKASRRADSTPMILPFRSTPMLQLAAVLLLIALVAAVFGFGGFVAGAVGAAKILFMLFLIGAIIAFVMGRRSV